MIIKIRHIISILAVVLAAVAVSSCSQSVDSTLNPVLPVEPEAGQAFMHLHIALANASSGSRTDYSAVAGANEMMQELRIIIVRPDLTIEHNDFISTPFLNNPLVAVGSFQYQVLSGEEKSVYLLANENACRTAASGEKVPLIDYDFSALEAGDKFPAAEIAALNITLDADTATLNGVLPMAECHKIDIPLTDPESPKVVFPYNLFLTRAAVKFEFHITNELKDIDFDIQSLAIDKVSSREYLFPNAAVYNDVHEITSFEVPNVGGDDYYSFVREYTGITAKGDNIPVDLPVFYLLESKYHDPTQENDDLNYMVRMRMNDIEYKAYLPNLSQMPRNTHVIVNVFIHNLNDGDGARSSYSFGSNSDNIFRSDACIVRCVTTFGNEY
ncbi:MAG: hypothetical protein K2M94_05750 [Paramuribaculum sp.]|nr:hypothetical protein [Paramuribaculum sp.]